MGGRALLIVLALALPEIAHAQGLVLSWGSCGERDRVSSISLACTDRDSVSHLTGTFEVADTIRGFVADDFTLDLEFSSADVPTFWRFGAQDCNRGGIGVSSALPSTGCEGIETPWVEGGGHSFAALINYQVGLGGPNHARLLLAVVRPSDSPVTLLPHRRYFAFDLLLFNDVAREAGGVCEGCSTPVRITWSASHLMGVPSLAGSTAADLTLKGDGLPAACVTLNGAPTCRATPITSPVKSKRRPR
jgi:hypothetical protein